MKEETTYVYHGRRHWVQEPTRYQHIGWNTDFEPCVVFSVTAKRIGILSPTLGILYLNRIAFDRDGKVYHSKPHEWFYKTKPAVDPEKPGKAYFDFMAKMNGTSEAHTILGVQVGCSKSEIKRAYKILAKTYHPDTEGGSHDAFIQLNRAYETLMEATTK